MSPPKLLSGENPQIPKGDGDGPVQAYLYAIPGWKQGSGRQLDEMISRVVPGVAKAIRWNTPFYGVEGQGWFLGFHCFTRYLKVSFLNGIALDPMPPVAPKSGDVRYLHLHEGDPLDPQVEDWIRQAAAAPGVRVF